MSTSRWLTPMRGGMRAVESNEPPHVLAIVGTRPEVIKMAPVVRAIRERGRMRVTLVSTGQHRELLTRAFHDVGIQPDIALTLMTTNQTPSEFVSRGITALDDVMVHERAAGFLTATLERLVREARHAKA